MEGLIRGLSVIPRLASCKSLGNSIIYLSWTAAANPATQITSKLVRCSTSLVTPRLAPTFMDECGYIRGTSPHWLIYGHCRRPSIVAATNPRGEQVQSAECTPLWRSISHRYRLGMPCPEEELRLTSNPRAGLQYWRRPNDRFVVAVCDFIFRLGTHESLHASP